MVLSLADPATAATRRPAERFNDLFRHFYPRLVPLAERLLGDRAEAEDIVQEAFLRLARPAHANPSASRSDGGVRAGDASPEVAPVDDAGGIDDSPLLERPNEVVGAWLRRVVLNLGINRLRDRRRADERLARASRLDPSLDPERGVSDDDSPPHALLRAEARDDVHAALVTLPERQRACLLLRHAGHSYAEIAATIGIAIGSVGVYLARAERGFRSAYCVEDPEASPDIQQGTTR